MSKSLFLFASGSLRCLARSRVTASQALFSMISLFPNEALSASALLSKKKADHNDRLVLEVELDYMLNLI